MLLFSFYLRIVLPEADKLQVVVDLDSGGKAASPTMGLVSRGSAMY